MGNKRNRHSARIDYQSSDRDEDISETSFTQGSELTELSQISNEIEAISERLSEQNNIKMTQSEQQLNNKSGEILKENRIIRFCNLVADEEDAENSRPSTSNSENFKSRKGSVKVPENWKGKNDKCTDVLKPHLSQDIGL